jgi:hypothetical protein
MDEVAPLSLELLHVIYNMPEMVETFPMPFSVIHQEFLLTDTVNLHILDTRERKKKEQRVIVQRWHTWCVE